MAESDIGDDEDPLVALPLHDPHDRGIQAARFSINVIFRVRVVMSGVRVVVS